MGVIAKAPEIGRAKSNNHIFKLVFASQEEEKEVRGKDNNRKPGYEPFLQTVVKQKRLCELQQCSIPVAVSQVGPR